jgi:hypothetical protein
MRFTRSRCSPRRGSGVFGADAGAGAVGADEAGEGDRGGDGDVVDASGVDASGADAGDVDDGPGGTAGGIVDGSGDVSCVDGSDGGSDTTAGGSCSSWNGCWNRHAISAKARFISGDSILASAFCISGATSPVILFCTHSLKVVGLSSGFAMDFELGGEV